MRVAAIIAIPLALICLLGLLVVGGVALTYTQNAISDNEAAIREARAATQRTRDLAVAMNADRKVNEHRLGWAVYDECIENENQDAALAKLLRKVRDLTAQGEPSAARTALLQSIQETIDAREPPGEKDCTIPPYPRPPPPA